MARPEDLTLEDLVLARSRLHHLSEPKGWAQGATAYNGLVTNWPELTRLAGAADPGRRDSSEGKERA